MADAGQKRKSTAKKSSSKAKAAGTGKTTKAKLQRAVRDEVSKKSKELAASLVGKAVAGSASSVSLVLKVLDDQIKEEEQSAGPEAGPQGPSAAERLAKEVPWEGPEKEERGGPPASPSE